MNEIKLGTNKDIVNKANRLLEDRSAMVRFITNILTNPDSCPKGFAYKFEHGDTGGAPLVEHGIIKGRIIFVLHMGAVSIRVTDGKGFYVDQTQRLHSTGFSYSIWNSIDGWEKPHYKGFKPLVVAKLAEVLLEVHAFRDDLAKRELESDSHLISELTQTVPEDVLQAMSVLCSK